MIQILLFILSLFLFCGATAQDELNSDPQIVKVNNHVVISRMESYPGHLLCHDGKDLFFKDLADCNEARVSTCKSLKVSPLAEVEEIKLNNNGSEVITRFFSKSLYYSVSVFEKSMESDWDYVLKDTLKKRIPSCDGEFYRDIEITYMQRSPVNQQERQLLQAIYDSGFNVINSPLGPIDNLSYLDQQSPDLDWSKIASHLKKNISTPECAGSIHEDTLKLLGGELSGNGITGQMLQQLQLISQPLKPEEALNRQEKSLKCEPEDVWI